MVKELWDFIAANKGTLALCLGLASFAWSGLTYWRNLVRERRRQFFEVHLKLLTTDERDVRRVIWELTRKPADVDPETEEKIESTLALFDAISLLSEHKVVDRGLFLQEWGHFLHHNAGTIDQYRTIRSGPEARSVWPHLGKAVEDAK